MPTLITSAGADSINMMVSVQFKVQVQVKMLVQGEVQVHEGTCVCRGFGTGSRGTDTACLMDWTTCGEHEGGEVAGAHVGAGTGQVHVHPLHLQQLPRHLPPTAVARHVQQVHLPHVKLGTKCEALKSSINYKDVLREAIE
jgi:hypothetical protein